MENSIDYQYMESEFIDNSNNIEYEEHSVIKSIEYEESNVLLPNDHVEPAPSRLDDQFKVVDQDLQKGEDLYESTAEINLTKLKYQEATLVVHCESRQIISTQESDKTTLIILHGQRNDILQKISDQQNLAEELRIKNESLIRNVELSEGEILSMQHQVVNNDVIVGKLTDFIKGMKSTVENLNQKNMFYSKEVNDQANKVKNLQISFKSRCDPLMKEIKEKKNQFNHTENKILQTDNCFLKQQIVQVRDRLDQLVNLHKKRKVEVDQNISLKESRTQLEQILAEKRLIVGNLEASLKSEKDMSSITHLDKELKEKKSKSCLLKTKIDDIIKGIMSEMNEKNNFEENLQKKSQELSMLEENSKELIEKLENMQSTCNSFSKLYEEQLDLVRKPLDSLNNEISLLVEENEKLKLNSNFKIKEYIEMLEEKNQLVITKCSLEEKVMAEKSLKTNIQLSDQEIEMNKSKVKKFQEQIDELSKDACIQDLAKNKAYQFSSQEYLTEKLNNIKESFNILNISLNIAHEKSNKLEEEFKEKLEKTNDLKKKLENNKSVTTLGMDTPVGILKSTPCKPHPISPKKVKFVGVSSNESDSLNEEATQQNEHGNMLDQLLEKFQQFKQSTNVVKKRKLDL